MTRKRTTQDGITLLITLLLMGVLLGVSASLLNITLKQYQLSGIGYASEVAFQAANAGMECALYQDWVNKEFEFGTGDPITCFENVTSNDLVNGTGAVGNATEQRFRFDWGTPQICTEISVYKFFNAASSQQLLIEGVDVRPGNNCPTNTTCTVIQARGYNVPCAQITTAPRVVEREYMQIHQTSGN